MRRHLLALLLAFASTFAFAQVTCTHYTASLTYGAAGPGPFYSAEEACTALGPIVISVGAANGFSNSITATRTTGGPTSGVCEIDYHSVRVSNGQEEDQTAVGQWGTNPNQSQCPNPCSDKAGDTTQERFTTGWARTSDLNSPRVLDIPLPRDGACDGQCAMDYVSSGSCYHSQIPAPNGLHRVSCTATMAYTGNSCSARTPSNDPATPEPPCPGFTSMVDGHPVCVGTEANPLPAIPMPPGTGPETPGNPAAGPRPPTGGGSGDTGAGATPTTGNGGNEGGGSNAAVPGGGSEGNGQGTGTAQPVNPDGSGTADEGSTEDQGIDETGMPSGAGAYDAANAALNQNRTDAVAGVNAAAAAAGKSTSWTFAFAFPTGCTEISLGAFAPYITGINICQWQDVIHELMSLAWLATTAFLCIGMVGRAIGGGSS